MTTYTVGSGQSYATVAAVAAVINGTTLSADAIIEIHGTVTDTAQVSLAGITVGAFGVYIQSASGTKFAGSPLRYGVSGDAWVLAYTGGTQLVVDADVGKFEILDLQIQRSSSANTGGNIILGDAGATGHAMRRCIVSIEGQADSAIQIWSGTLENILVVNNSTYLQYAVVDNGNGFAKNVGCIDLNAGSNSASSVGFGNFGGSGFPLTCTNCWAIGWDADCTGSSAIAGSYNATDKSAGSTNFPSTNRQVDVVAATELVDAAGADYDANIKSTSVKFLALGTASGAPSTDIMNAAWNASRDIGPIKYAAAGANNTITAAFTLGAATSSATVKGRAGITSARTLGAATSSATVKGRAGITSARTLGTLTSAATLGGPRTITSAKTLGQLGSSASLLNINPSQANNTLGQLTSAATVKAVGSISSTPTLGALTSVAGINVNTVSASQTLGALTSAAAAKGIASASSAKTLGQLVAAAFIAPNSIITGSPTLDAMVSQAVIAHGHVMRPTWTRKPSHSATWTRRA
jgi:hypothetical protein